MKETRTWMVVTPAVMLALLLALHCAPYLSEDDAACPCEDGWTCCMGRCIPEGDTCSSGDGGGGGDGGTTEECPCIEGWKCCMDTCIPDEAYCPPDGVTRACACRNPLDTVDANSIEVVCYRKDYTCNALNLCEAGYECDHHNHCVCVDPAICGIDCSSGDCKCPGNTVCDPNVDACRPPWMCLDDSMCATGQVCRQGYDGLTFYTCQTQTANAVGESCLRSWECNSGVCYTNVCLQFCTRNADCPDNLLCAEVDHGELGCVINTECNPPCTGPEEYCADWGQECRSDFCRTSADCPGGLCAIELYRPLAGQCLPYGEPDLPDCEDNEFVSMPMLHHGYCIVYRACWSDADCQSPYTCVSADMLGAPTIVDTGLCARLSQP
jgi:hypothetical protein